MSVVRIDQLSANEKIIALMGPTGTGKSTFIDFATRQDGKNAGHKLKSCTSDIRAVRYNGTGGPYVLVDTPGFDDTNKTDSEILTLIADWLKKTYKDQRVRLSGIIYLHRISDNRMAGSPLKNLQMFANLCGTGASQNVILATTMWSRVKPEVGSKREAELKGKYWHGMIELGSQAMRFEDSFDSAWDIIGKAIKQDIHTLLLQEEMVDLERRLSETEAGKTLYTTLQKLLAEQKDVIRKLRDEAKAEENEELAKELNSQMQELENNLQSTFDQIANMRIPLGRRILMFFSFKKSSSVGGSSPLGYAAST